MPTLNYAIEDAGSNILQTVSDQVVTGLLDELDLRRLFKDSVYQVNSFSTNSQYDDGNGSPSLNKNRCDVEVSFVLDKTQVPWPNDSPYTTSAYGERNDNIGRHTPILYDKKANLLIEHFTVPCALEMAFRMNFQTFDDAVRSFDRIKSKYVGTLVQAPWDIAFSYPVSMPVLKYLYTVYKAKMDYQNKDFSDYLNDNKISDISWDFRKTQFLDPHGDKELMIRCRQLRCAGQLTMDQKEPEVQRENQLADSFVVEFNFVFQFGRPVRLAIHSPIAVDNTLLPQNFFANINNPYHWSPEAAGVFQDLPISDFMKRSYGDYSRSANIIRIPDYDDWFVSDRQYGWFGYRPFMIVHFTLDGPQTTIDLKQLSDISLHPVVQEIFKETGSSLFQYGALFHIGVFGNDIQLDSRLLSIDENLILTITSSRPDVSYHLVISETTKLNRTDGIWDYLLLKYRYFFPMTIERNLKYLVDKKYFYIVGDDSFLGLLSRMLASTQAKHVLDALVALKEDTVQIYWYTQNAAQLADYLIATPSLRTDYTLPEPSAQTQVVLDYYSTKASVEGRSLFVAFMEQALLMGYITLDQVPAQYLQPNQSIYPYTLNSGGYYGCNTPLRAINFNLALQRPGH